MPKKDNNNTNNNINGQNLINPYNNRYNDNTSSTTDAALEKVADSLNQVNNGLDTTVKAIKDGFKQISATDKKQNKELNTAISKLTAAITNNTKFNQGKTKKENKAAADEEKRQSRLDRIAASLTEKQQKAAIGLKGVIDTLDKQIKHLNDDTSAEGKRLKANFEDLNQFLTDFVKDAENERSDFSLGADKFGKTIDNISISFNTQFTRFSDTLKALDNDLTSLVGKEKTEAELRRKNLIKLNALEVSRLKAAQASAKLNKDIDNLKYNSELRRSEFEIKSAKQSQKLFNQLASKVKDSEGNDVIDLYSDTNAKLMKSIQSINEHRVKAEENYINTGNKGPFYTQIRDLINDLEDALFRNDTKNFKIIESMLVSYEQSRDSALQSGNRVGALDSFLAEQNATNAKNLALNTQAQQELAEKYILDYKNVVAKLKQDLIDLEAQKQAASGSTADIDKKIVAAQTRLNGALTSGASIAEIGAQLGSGGIKTRSEIAIENLKPERDSIEKQRAVNFKELDEINRLLSSDDLGKGDKKELEERKELLEKQNQAIDTAIDEITQMVTNIQKGNLKAASKNMQNINKARKTIDKIEDSEEEFLDRAAKSFDAIKESVKPQGTLSNLISKGLKFVANEVIDYGAKSFTNALSSLDQSYKSQGMSIAKQNMYTRKDIQRIMGDIGSELSAQGIKGIDTTDVLDMAETLANNGVTDEATLKDFAMAMTKAAAVNPELKAEFGDVETLKYYQKIYDEAEKSGQSGYEAIEKDLDTKGSALRGVKVATGNGYAFSNGQLAELDAANRDFATTYGLSEERRNELTNSSYALAGVVGKNGSDFISWYNDTLNLAKTGLSDSTRSVITGTTDGQKLMDALDRGDIGKYISGAYAKLLSYDYDENGNVKNYDQSYEMLMQSLGIDTADINKIRRNSDYLDKNGKFSVEKFTQAYENALKATTNNDYEKKKKQNLEEGLMQTVEESNESKAINTLTTTFTTIAGTDIPHAIEETIKASEAAADLLKDAIDSGIDLVIKAIAGGSVSNLLGGGIGKGVGGLLGKAGGLLGKAGSVGAGLGVVGIAAGTFAAAYSVGTVIDKWTGASDKLSDGLLDLDPKFAAIDKDLEEAQKIYEAETESIKKANAALDTFKTAVTNGSEALSDDANKLVSSDEYQKNLAKYVGKAQRGMTESGTKVKSTENTHANVKAIETVAKMSAAAAIDTEKPEMYWDDVMVHYLKNAGYNDEQVKTMKKEYDNYYSIAQTQKRLFEQFNQKYGADLFAAWQAANEMVENKQAKSHTDAWNTAFDEMVKSKKYTSADDIVAYKTSGYLPQEGKDFKIEGNMFYLLPGQSQNLQGNLNAYKQENWGKYATGLETVPYNNYPALLHKGERVQTAAEVVQDELQQELNRNLEVLNTNLANNDNTITETFDDKQIINSIESQTNDMNSLIESVLSILNIIANNTQGQGNNVIGSSSNYLMQALENRSTKLSDFKNPTMY